LFLFRGSTPTTVKEALEARSSAGAREAAFADDLERVGAEGERTERGEAGPVA